VGIVFGMLFLVFAALVLGGLVGIVLCLAAYFSGGGWPRLKRVAVWGVLALPLSIVYLVVSVVAYGVWCESVRGVDPGIADYQLIPLQDGFSLTFIDVPNRAAIYPRHETDGEALLPNIQHIGMVDGVVFGDMAQGEGFVLHTASGQIDRMPLSALPGALREIKAAGPVELLPVQAFYLARRYGWLDALAVIVIGVPLLFAGLWSWRRAWRHRVNTL
jgi:hypothetical protein